MTQPSFSASAALLADGRPALLIGEVIGTLLFPAVGITLLIVGLIQQSKANRARPVYPAYPPPPGYPAYPPPPGYPAYPPPPRSTAGRGLIIAGSVVLVLSLIGMAGKAAMMRNDRGAAESFAPPAKIGQCITSEAMASGVIKRQDVVECTEPTGVFEVVSTGPRNARCPDGAREETDFARWTDDSSTLCLMPNLLVDQCYTTVKHPIGDANRTDTIRPVACTDASAEFRVLQRIEQADYGLCPVGAKQSIWTVPPRTYCTGPPS